MSGAAYRQRIAASKAAIDADLVALARGNPGLTPAAFVALARARLNVAVDLAHAAALIGARPG